MKCKSCGVAWIDHPGPENQCAQMQRLLERLAQANKDLAEVFTPFENEPPIRRPAKKETER